MSIEKQFNKILEPLKEEILAFSWEDQKSYELWLAQTYYFVIHSTRLFSFAASRCSIDDNILHFQLLDHLREEKGHENLATQDLKALGQKIVDLPELPETSSFYQLQYFWIEHYGPESFFGYLLCLEGLAVIAGQQVYERAKKNYGDKACKFLKVHVGEDQQHLKEVFAHVETFSSQKRTAMFRNMEQSANLFGYIFKAIASQSTVNSVGEAA